MYELSSKEFRYIELKILKTLISPNREEEWVTTAEILNNKSEAIYKIEYPTGHYKKLEIYDYDDTLNPIKKQTHYKDKVETDIVTFPYLGQVLS